MFTSQWTKLTKSIGRRYSIREATGVAPYIYFKRCYGVVTNVFDSHYSGHRWGHAALSMAFHRNHCGSGHADVQPTSQQRDWCPSRRCIVLEALILFFLLSAWVDEAYGQARSSASLACLGRYVVKGDLFNSGPGYGGVRVNVRLNYFPFLRQPLPTAPVTCTRFYTKHRWQCATRVF